MNNNTNSINVGKVILGLGLAAGCAAYAWIKTKKKAKEVIDISQMEPIEEVTEPRQ